MKRIAIIVATICVAGLYSFKPLDEGERKTNTFYATINNELFRWKAPSLKISSPNSALLKGAPVSVLDVSFSGPFYTSREGKPFEENIQFKIGYPSDGSTKANYYVTMQYQGVFYHMIKDSSDLEISSLALSGDNKTLMVSADFECKMRSYGFPGDGKKDLTLKGKIDNMTIATSTESQDLADRQ